MKTFAKVLLASIASVDTMSAGNDLGEMQFSTQVMTGVILTPDMYSLDIVANP